MNTAQVKCFLTAAECLNFTAAAEKLYISQPVLSRNIAALEDELGVLLFVRSNNTVRLTPGGTVIYQWLKENQISRNDALMRAKRENMQPKGELRIGFVTTEVTTEREARAILEFQRQYPETRLTIFHGSAQECTRQLTEHSIDVATMVDSRLNHDERLCSVEVARDNQCIAVSKAHPLAEFEPISLRAFASEVFISLKPEYSPVMTDRIRALCGAVGFVPRILEVDNAFEQLDQVEAQRGVALVPDNHVSKSSPLVRQLRLKEDFPLRLVCVWDRLNTNPSIEKYLEILKETNKI